MKHVIKKQWMGCAVASAAMLAEVSYDEAAGHWPKMSDADLRRPQEFCALLESLTETRWHLSHCWFPCRALSQFEVPDHPVAVFIENDHFGHWVVLKGELVHDPGAYGPFLISRYPYRGWWVTHVAQPQRPEEVEAFLKQSRLKTLTTALRPLLHAAYRLPQSNQSTALSTGLARE
jgi:hypothetical protein